MEQVQKIIVSGILEKEGVLLAKRPLTKKIAPGKYHLPGGHVEFGEDPEVALKREFFEEFNLNIEVGEVVRTFSYHEDARHTVGITYKIQTNNLSDLSFNPEDTEEIVWIMDALELSNFLSEDRHDYVTLKKYFSLK
jgi:ADP-ribose pyrophosphatase YjhB (NUDIX family)